MHGINLGGWLSQCDHNTDHYKSFITENDFETIRSWNLDHVRIPADYDLVETASGETIEEGFEIIDQAYTWCRNHDLNIILDLHKTFGFSFDAGEQETGFFENEAYQERFYRLWSQFARRYGKYHDHMAFELLNEVTEKVYSDVWNQVIGCCIKTIRNDAPDTWIITGGYYNNSIEALNDLAKPYDDHVVYTFHCYEPLIFTHQGAYWAPGMDTSFRMLLETTYGEMAKLSDQYLSQVTVGFESFDQKEMLNSAFFDHYFEEAVSIAEERKVPLYCGEYGVINLAEPEDTVKWYDIISKSFDTFHIGRAAWTYKEKDFGIIDEHMKDVREEVVKKL